MEHVRGSPFASNQAYQTQPLKKTEKTEKRTVAIPWRDTQREGSTGYGGETLENVEETRKSITLPQRRPSSRINRRAIWKESRSFDLYHLSTYCRNRKRMRSLLEQMIKSNLKNLKYDDRGRQREWSLRRKTKRRKCHASFFLVVAKGKLTVFLKPNFWLS